MALSNPVQKPDEMVQLVDEDGHDLGAAPRWQVRKENLLHRASAVIIFNSQGEVFVQKRVSFKETFPGYYDCCPGGVCGSDETVSENAIKEIHEEMGIVGAELRHQFDYLHISAGLQYWGSLFSCIWDGPLRLQPQEVESGMFMSMQDLKQLLHTGAVCPDSVQAMLQYLKQQASADCDGNLVSEGRDQLMRHLQPAA